MKQKTAIVTGSSSGFGLLSVLELAKSGFHVIATMRKIENATPLLEMATSQGLVNSIEIQPLDVTCSQSIQTLINFLSTQQTVDVLVNNAGFALGGFCEDLTVDDYRHQFETNVFGLIAVTQAVLPFMRQNKRGRIINLSSISGQIGFPGLSAYTSSKHAIEGFSESLRLEVQPFGIDVILIEPGSYNTNIWVSIDKATAKNKQLTSPYDFYQKVIVSNIEKGKDQFGDPLEVAELIAKIASQTKRPKLRYPIGKGVKTNLFLKKILPWGWIEKIILKKLFEKERI